VFIRVHPWLIILFSCLRRTETFLLSDHAIAISPDAIVCFGGNLFGFLRATATGKKTGARSDSAQ
jgi:hypothetical protein